MWNLVVLFIGITSTIIPICKVDSRPLRDIDVATILNVLNKPPGHFHSHKHEHSLESKSSDDAKDTEDNSHYGSLKSREIVELIKQATHDKHNNDISSDEKEIVNKNNHISHKIHGAKDLDDRINNNQPRAKVSVDDSTIKQILSYFQSQIIPKEKPRKQVVKNLKVVPDLVHSMLTRGGNKHDRAEVMDDYSKIYIILDPSAVQKSSAKDSLSDIISKISSLSSISFPKERAVVKKDKRYKGFSVKEGVFSRRARRDSKEKYDPKDSMEDYKQKRARNDHGSGRTAIPYIRHRGDIYERDN